MVRAGDIHGEVVPKLVESGDVDEREMWTVTARCSEKSRTLSAFCYTKKANLTDA